MKRSLVFLDAILIAAGLSAAFAHPSPEWVEATFSNGWYPKWENFWGALTAPFSFSVGDLVVLAGVAILAIKLWQCVALMRRGRFAAPLFRLAIGVAGLAGLYALWFYAGWGWGYARAPLQTRVLYDSSRLNAAELMALRRRAIAQLNRLAPQAHALQTAAPGYSALNYELLQNAWLPVVQRLGDRWTPVVGPAKSTLAGFFMNANGTSGFTNPFTLETQLAPDLLWFERPFNQAHEWSHAAGFNRESEANYIAALTCLRDSDPIAQYSGWLELFLYLPPLAHYPHKMFVQQVWQDFAAIRARNAHFVNVNFSRFSWQAYNSYLKSNRIASGVRNYGEVTQLLIAIPLDRQGLPLALPATTR